MQTELKIANKPAKRNNKAPKKTNETSEKNSPVLVAVITAAIAAARGKSASDVRIASVQPVGPIVKKVAPVVSFGDLWAQAGRIEAMNSRQKFF